MNKNDYYSDFRCLNPNGSLTCIIGAVGEDGCVIVSDRRETIGSEIRDVSKIHPIWNNTAVIAGAGDARLLYKLTQSISGSIPVFPQVVETIEYNVNELRICLE
ncbi:MAG: hypothetical protein WAK17_09975 [Candidatus Nitrosopolaris sp.]